MFTAFITAVVMLFVIGWIIHVLRKENAEFQQQKTSAGLAEPASVAVGGTAPDEPAGSSRETLEVVRMPETPIEPTPAPVYLVTQPNIAQGGNMSGDYAPLKIKMAPIFWGVLLANLATALIGVILYVLNRI